MTIVQYILGAVCCLSLAAGQLLFKFAANKRDTAGELLPVHRIVFTWPMISACVLYALTILLYVYLLQRIPLSRAYLFSIAGAAIVPLLAILIFKEPYSWKYISGVAFVIIGITLSTDL